MYPYKKKVKRRRSSVMEPEAREFKATLSLLALS
jgi:hypothetical protein